MVTQGLQQAAHTNTMCVEIATVTRVFRYAKNFRLQLKIWCAMKFSKEIFKNPLKRHFKLIFENARKNVASLKFSNFKLKLFDVT